MIDCAAKISSSDLVMIGAAPKVLDFGVVSVNSKNPKCLGITNDLSQHILVEVLFEEHEELATSHPSSQVIPPGAKAGFDVIFFSTSQPPQNQSNRFRQSLTYVVNKKHKFTESIGRIGTKAATDVGQQTVGTCIRRYQSHQIAEEVETAPGHHQGAPYWLYFGVQEPACTQFEDCVGNPGHQDRPQPGT